MTSCNLVLNISRSALANQLWVVIIPQRVSNIVVLLFISVFLETYVSRNQQGGAYTKQKVYWIRMVWAMFALLMASVI